jgi:DNA-directed RNA polymerase subunit F
MSDTPETDKIWDDLCGSWCNWSVDFAHEKLLDKSRKLERERDEALEYADKLAEGLPDGMLPKDVEVLREANLGLATNIAAVTEQRDRLAKACDQYSEDEILCKLHKVTEQRDRLAEALERVLGYQGRFAEEDPESIAAEALAAVKGGSDECR